MLTIKILGPGCPNCEKLNAIAHQAAANLGAEAVITKITDREGIRNYKVLATPGLVINEKLVCAGRIPNETEIIGWLADAMENA